MKIRATGGQSFSDGLSARNGNALDKLSQPPGYHCLQPRYFAHTEEQKDTKAYEVLGGKI